MSSITHIRRPKGDTTTFTKPAPVQVALSPCQNDPFHKSHKLLMPSHSVLPKPLRQHYLTQRLMAYHTPDMNHCCQAIV